MRHVVRARFKCLSVLNAKSSVFRLVFGTLYPAYSSYKAVKSKDVKEYVSISFVFMKYCEANVILIAMILGVHFIYLNSLSLLHFR